MRWAILFLGVATNATASLLIKYSATPPRRLPSLDSPASWGLNSWPLWLGLVFYGFAFLTYVVALSVFPASLAHPILTAGAIAMVVTLSVLLFGETLTLTSIIGVVMIIAGVVTMALGSKS